MYKDITGNVIINTCISMSIRHMHKDERKSRIIASDTELSSRCNYKKQKTTTKTSYVPYQLIHIFCRIQLVENNGNNYDNEQYRWDYNTSKSRPAKRKQIRDHNPRVIRTLCYAGLCFYPAKCSAKSTLWRKTVMKTVQNSGYISLSSCNAPNPLTGLQSRLSDHVWTRGRHISHHQSHSEPVEGVGAEFYGCPCGVGAVGEAIHQYT